MILFRDGEPVEKFVGVQSVDDLVRAIEKYSIPSVGQVATPGQKSANDDTFSPHTQKSANDDHFGTEEKKVA